MGSRRQIAILFAHTNPTFLMYAGVLIKRLGYTVSLSRDGVEVVSKAKEEKPDIIVMEPEMPRMNGLSCLSMIRNDVDMKDIPVLVFDTGLDEARRADFEQLGANGFLAMPLNISQFYLAIQNCLRHAAKRRYVRAPLSLKVFVECGQERAELFASDLSAEGMCLRTLKPFRVGATLSIVFSIDDEDPIELTGQVVSARGLDHDFSREPGMGIKFIDIPEDSRYRLYYFLLKELTADFERSDMTAAGFDESFI